MKHNQLTKKFWLVALLLAALTPTLNAFTYSDGDLLLVFRKSTFNDIEFNLGTVNNFLGKPNGTVINVNNFNLAQLNANFSANLNGVTVSLVACTPAPAVQSVSHFWTTDADLNTTRQDITGSRFNTTWSKVNNIGVQAQVNSTNGATQTFIASSGDASSYSYIASSGGAQDPGSLSGAVLFSIEGQIPVTLRFWQLTALNARPNETPVGTFAILANGTVTFTAGSGGGGCTPPPITVPPANATVFAGGPASFNVSATGATAYQWQFNGADISGATGSGYSLASAHGTNAGNYRVIVSNGSCAATSTLATLTVNLPVAGSLGSVSKAPGGPFSLKLTGTSGAYYEIQCNTNLNFTNAWTTIAFLTNSGGMTTFNDVSATNAAQKFYRAVAR